MTHTPPSPDPGLSGMDRALRRPRLRAGRIAAGAGALAVIAVLSVLGWRALPGGGDLVVRSADLAVAEAVEGPFEDALPARGIIAPLRTVQVAAIEGGQVQSVLVEDGAHVEPGQPLAELSNPRLRMEVVASEAQIASQLGNARAQALQIARNRLEREREIGEAGFNLQSARRELGIRSRLHATGVVSDAGLADAQSQVDYFQSRLDMLNEAQRAEEGLARAQSAEIAESIDRLQSNLEGVRASLDALIIHAPAPGRLTAFDLVPGQPLSAGAIVGQVDSEDAFKLVAEIDEFYLARIEPGQSAQVRIGARNWPLSVARVLPQVTAGRFRAELVFAGETPPGLRRGQTLDIRLMLGETRHALILPAGPWLSSTGGARAYVLDAQGRTASLRDIRTGRRSPTQVEILEGLAPGERVVTSSYDHFNARPRLVLR